MTNTEKLIAHIKERIKRRELAKLEWELDTISKLLNALPCYEEDKIYEIFCAKEELVEAEETEVSYKTYDAKEISVGDELTDGEFVGVCVGVEGNEVNVVLRDGSTGQWDTEDWNRTGRNFPAVEKILNTMNNAEVENA